MAGIWDLGIRKTPIAVVDFETTGRFADSHRVVEASVVRLEPGGRLNVAFDSLINPRQRIEYAATQVRGTGNGSFKCSHCKGTGRSGSFQCAFCNGKKWQRCNSCRGNGFR